MLTDFTALIFFVLAGLTPGDASQGVSSAGIRLVVSGAKEPLTTCADTWLDSTYSVRVDNLPAENAGGKYGKGMEVGGKALGLEEMGHLKLSQDGKVTDARGSVFFRKGEPIRLTLISQVKGGYPGDRLAIWFTSVMKRNITRGQGAMEHQTPERFNSSIDFPLQMDCDTFTRVWQSYFAVADTRELAKWQKDYPGGVIVNEIKEGMTFTEVEAILGSPERKATLTGKTIYFYPKMKVVFRNGKVADIE